MNPLVSVCIPNYNMASYLKPAIMSGLEQTYEKIEVVVVDNCSTDASWQIMQEMASADSRVRIFKNDSNLGMVRNWNRCLEVSRGEYVNLLSADDLLNPEYVSRCMELFNAYPNLGYVFTEWDNINEKDQILPRKNFYKQSAILNNREEGRLNFIGGHTVPSSMLIHKQRFLKVGGYDVRYDCSHDIDAKLKLNLFHDVGYLNDRLCKYRIHSEQSITGHQQDTLLMMEYYRVRMSLLKKYPQESQFLRADLSRMKNRMARYSCSKAEEALCGGFIQLAGEFLGLALSFDQEISNSFLYNGIQFFLDNFSELFHMNYKEFKVSLKGPVTQTNSGPPYDLPDKSILI